MTDSFEEIFGDKQKIMVVFAHPDDAEIMCGGTIARLIKEGKEVRIVKMTSGDKGSRDKKFTKEELSGLRQTEDAKSMKILGIKPENSVYLGLEDGAIGDSVKEIELVVKQIREFRPEIIITHNPENIIIRFSEGENWINHRDHTNTAKVVTYAAYPYSRDLSFFPEHFDDPKLASHTVGQFLYVDYYGHPDEVFIEMTDFVETRLKAMQAHESQYSKESSESTTEFMTKNEDGKNYERFRYVKAD